MFGEEQLETKFSLYALPLYSIEEKCSNKCVDFGIKGELEVTLLRFFLKAKK